MVDIAWKGFDVKRIIAGNWKMYKTIREARELADKIVQNSFMLKSKIEVVLCPSFVALDAVADCLQGSSVKLGAQNMHHRDSGAFTGECSGQMLQAVGCDYVILGHSERRHVFNETDAEINLKALAALQYGLKPILCVGETEKERDLGLTWNVVERHVRHGLAGVKIESIDTCVIAYEPVWAIGTGRTATPEQAREAHEYLRGLLQDLYGEKGSMIPILYGGSVKPENIAELLKQPEVNGALVGGASLKADSFNELIRITGEIDKI